MSKNNQIKREKIFDSECDKILEILKIIKYICKEHNCFIFQNTTLVDFIKFIQKK